MERPVSFIIRLRAGDGTVRLLGDLSFSTVEEAYLDACAAIPEAAGAELRARRNPFRCAFLIAEQGGAVLLEVPFSDILPPSERESVPSDPALVPAKVPWNVELLRARVDRARQLRFKAEECQRRAAAKIDRSFHLIEQSRIRHFSGVGVVGK